MEIMQKVFLSLIMSNNNNIIIIIIITIRYAWQTRLNLNLYS